MKSNRSPGTRRTSPDTSSLHHTVSQEKEMLVTMFLSSASEHDLTEQIKKIDELCLRIEDRNKRRLPD